jgi:hypothetical protein
VIMDPRILFTNSFFWQLLLASTTYDGP